MNIERPELTDRYWRISEKRRRHLVGTLKDHSECLRRTAEDSETMEERAAQILAVDELVEWLEDDYYEGTRGEMLV